MDTYLVIYENGKGRISTTFEAESPDEAATMFFGSKAKPSSPVIDVATVKARGRGAFPAVHRYELELSPTVVRKD